MIRAKTDATYIRKTFVSSADTDLTSLQKGYMADMCARNASSMCAATIIKMSRLKRSVRAGVKVIRHRKDHKKLRRFLTGAKVLLLGVSSLTPSLFLFYFDTFLSADIKLSGSSLLNSIYTPVAGCTNPSSFACST